MSTFATPDALALPGCLSPVVNPEQRLQLLAMAQERLPALRAEIEFWTLVLARIGGSGDPDATASGTSKPAHPCKQSTP